MIRMSDVLQEYRELAEKMAPNLNREEFMVGIMSAHIADLHNERNALRARVAELEHKLNMQPALD